MNAKFMQPKNICSNNVALFEIGEYIQNGVFIHIIHFKMYDLKFIYAKKDNFKIKFFYICGKF